MGRYTENARYFLICQKYAWKDWFVYRLQGAIWVALSLMSTVVTYAGITIIYNVSSGIPGWNYLQLLLLSTSSNMVMSLVWFFINPWSIVNKMRIGKLDPYLIRPFGKMTCVLSGVPGALSLIAGALSSAGIVAYVIFRLGIGPLLSIPYVLMLLMGTAALTMIFLAVTVISYIFMRSAQFSRSVFNLGESAGAYPIAIYGIGFQVFFSLLLPIGFAYYYPSEILFGKLGVSFILVDVLALAIAIVSSYAIFNRLIKEYESGGG
jgi:ABC-type uncharacterized transport system permease subunit